MKSVSAAKKRFLKLSAGRVQTPTLSILVDREKEIKKFVPEPYWLIKALLDGEIEADHVDGKIFDKTRAEEIFSNCENSDAAVDKIKYSNSTTKPPVPFNLGGLQLIMSLVFHLKKLRLLLKAFILQDIHLIHVLHPKSCLKAWISKAYFYSCPKIPNSEHIFQLFRLN